ncbi:MAG: type III-A CRISPR-associated RAMP protein Csm3 [Nitrospirae bacterium]|jgi:CRISPR-associated protein Csm3|nr:type III-A CRISPR-associated RAMP protein Csm3 [Nitrospirota bacterium]
MKLTEIKKIEGKITLKSGLHIGSGNMEMHIGGTDSPVIKHPHTLEPYIPGSSLKGKVRSLLEMESGLIPFASEEGGLVSSKTIRDILGNNGISPELKTQLVKKAESILKIFGSSGADREDETGYGPTRVSFSDCYLNDNWTKKAKDNRWLLTEEKSENVINRIKGTAEHPRFIERVPEGTQFDFRVTFKILQDGDDQLFDTLLKGLKLLEQDTLGGSGSRGYGRISFQFNDEAIDRMFQTLNPF